MLNAVAERQLTKLERVALNLDQARSDDLRASWTFTLLDAQGHAAVVRPQVVLQVVPMADFAAIADRVIQENADDGHWDEKTQRQARSISNLFVKFMAQDQRIHDLAHED